MNNAALVIPAPKPAVKLTVVETPRRKVSALAIEIGIVGLLLCAMQIADGIMTGVGVLHYGTSLEGNFFLRSLMQHFGVVTALVAVKFFAMVIIFILCRLSFSVRWLPSALKVVFALYFFCAIVPWSYILFGSHL